MNAVVPDSASGPDTVVGPPASRSAREPRDMVGGRLGRYVVLGEVGRGGMGRVLRGYDPKLQREVALKELRHDALGPAGRARLVAEARAMAKLSHPNVVPIHDVEQLGPDADHLVMVMEFVDGQTLAQWLRGDPTWQDIVVRFALAGRGLAAAHDAGLLHRDFKPANVLLADDGRVKVSDFGLAKTVETMREPSIEPEEPANVDTGEELTRTGAVMGTPRFMAPEQHLGEPLSPAADQFAFCVALWEALCGSAPYSGERLGARKRRGPPPWPGGPAPKRLVDILHRGLAPMPEDRWPDMPALVAELDALVAPPKRRGTTSIAVIAVGLAGLAGWGMRDTGKDDRCSGAEEALSDVWTDARRKEVEQALGASEAPYAGRVARDTGAVLDAYAVEWVAMHTDACMATTVRAEQSAALMDLRMTCLDDVKRELNAVTTELILADEALVARAHRLVDGLPPIQACADLERLQDGARPVSADAEAVERAREYLAHARVAHLAGRFEASKKSVAAARETSAGVDFEPLQAELLLAQARTQAVDAKYDDAVRSMEAALEYAVSSNQRDTLRTIVDQLMLVLTSRKQDVVAARRYLPLARGLADTPAQTADVLHQQGNMLDKEGNYTDAEAAFRRVVELHEEAGSDALTIAKAQGELATAIANGGRLAEATAVHRDLVDVFRRALGPGHPKVADALNNFAISLAENGDPQAAIPVMRESLEIRAGAYGGAHPMVAGSRTNLSHMLREVGRYDEAEVEIRAAVTAMRVSLEAGHPNIGRGLETLGLVLEEQGRFDEAEEALLEALAIKKARLGERNPDVGVSHANLANNYLDQLRFDEAAASYHRALEVWKDSLDSGHPMVVTVRSNLALALSEQGKYAEAAVLHREVLAKREATLDDEHRDLARSRKLLATDLLALGKRDEALLLAEAAWTRLEKNDIPKKRQADAAQLLGKILWKSGTAAEKQRGRALVERAMLLQRELGDDDQQRALEDWLASHR